MEKLHGDFFFLESLESLEPLESLETLEPPAFFVKILHSRRAPFLAPAPPSIKNLQKEKKNHHLVKKSTDFQHKDKETQIIAFLCNFFLETFFVISKNIVYLYESRECVPSAIGLKSKNL